MILVTGTKRSGTSLWMQILINGGFPFIGNAYSGIWKESIGDANRKGFYESKLRHGINFQNNPNPDNGVYLHPKPTVQHAVKIFVPGLLKTEFAFIHRVVGTIRPWNEYCSSIERLLTMEDEYMLSQAVKEGELPREVRSIVRRPNVHPAFVWWKDNFTLLSDTLTRKYAINLVAYDKLLEEPENVIPLVLSGAIKLGHRIVFAVKSIHWILILRLQRLKRDCEPNALLRLRGMSFLIPF